MGHEIVEKDHNCFCFNEFVLNNINGSYNQNKRKIGNWGNHFTY